MSETMQIELADCENQLLREIVDHRLTRRDVAKTYALTLKSSEARKVNWAKVNLAIVERWSPYALEWIKKQAWSGKCFEPRRRKESEGK
jgi:hypothetical protein